MDSTSILDKKTTKGLRHFDTSTDIDLILGSASTRSTFHQSTSLFSSLSAFRQLTSTYQHLDNPISAKVAVISPLATLLSS
ncbi:hypothetical protein A7U60_g6022 [Sanghuangporus baumii]|uniref:Uncharacterized protein n=1 Tax=Sanghuangporus baumii TaxID=108892 RepID=A0A9Q5HVX1_SANBA|nr:hypothetical protein A7U60_g6022 [Sanghuangporus baumii]